MKGCNSNIAYIDLTNHTTRIEIVEEEILLSYLGGRGVNSYLLNRDFVALDSPLDPRNITIVSAGLFVNTSMFSSGRTCISFLMNAEGTSFTDSNMGGRFATAMKSAGVDVLYITGRSEELCYILVQDGKVTIKEALCLKSKDTYETDLLLKEQHSGARTISIGPAGELLSPYAVVCGEDRAAGGSSGVVWGAKHLKAIVAVQRPTLNTAKNQDAFATKCKETEDYVKSHPVYEDFKKFGTTCLVDIHNKSGNFPVNNWTEGSDPLSTNVNHIAVYNRSIKNKEGEFEKERFGCYGCALGGCSHVYDKDSRRTYKLEYEALNCLSFKVGRSSLELVLRLNTWCNRVGVDFIRVTGFVAAAADAGRLYIKDLTDNEFEQLFKKIAIRPPRSILDDRVFQKRVVEVKGKAASSFDPRANVSSALAMATSTRGADHLRSLSTVESYYAWYMSMGYDPGDYITRWLGVPKEIYDRWMVNRSLEKGYQGKELLTYFYQANNVLADALSLCKFHTSWRFGIGFEKLADLVSPLTGIAFTWQDLHTIGNNINRVERELLQKYNQTDDLPERFFTEGTTHHPPLDKEKFNDLLQRYYTVCEYDKEGYPIK